MSRCTQRATCTLQVHFWSVHQQFFTFLLRHCSVILHYLCLSFFFSSSFFCAFFLTMATFTCQSEPHNSISDEVILFWPMTHRQSRLWANRHIQLEKFISPCNNLTKNGMNDAGCQKEKVFWDVCVQPHDHIFSPWYYLMDGYFRSNYLQGCDCDGTWLHATLAQYKLHYKVDVVCTIWNCIPVSHVCYQHWSEAKNEIGDFWLG